MSTCVILNPTAGGGTSPGRLARALSGLDGVELRLSAGPGEVASMAAEASRQGFSRVVAAGGDGTVSELATGLLAMGGGAEAGILPVGTGNDLARSLGIPSDLEGAVRVLRDGVGGPVDAIVADAPGTAGGFAWNAVVGGFGGRISDRMSGELKRRWRSLAYLRAAVQELVALRPHRLGLEIDGTAHEADALMLVLANGRYAGGSIPFAPGAVPDDGCLDVVLVSDVARRELVSLGPRILLGRHLGAPGVRHWRARRVVVAAGPEFWTNLDGETWVAGDASFAVRPSALRFVRPRSPT